MDSAERFEKFYRETKLQGTVPEGERRRLTSLFLIVLAMIAGCYVTDNILFTSELPRLLSPTFRITAALMLSPLPLGLALTLVMDFLRAGGGGRAFAAFLHLDVLPAKPIRLVLRVFSLTLPAVFLLCALSYLAFRFLGLSTEGPHMADLFLKGPPGALAIMAFFAIVVAPLTEELLFRRILFGFLSSWVGVWPGIVGTSAIFAVFHDCRLQYAALFLLAVVLQLLYIRHKSLWPSILLHSLNNSLAVFFLLACRLAGWMPPDWL